MVAVAAGAAELVQLLLEVGPVSCLGDTVVWVGVGVAVAILVTVTVGVGLKVGVGVSLGLTVPLVVSAAGAVVWAAGGVVVAE